MEHLGKDAKIKGRCVEAPVDRNSRNTDESEDKCRENTQRHSGKNTGLLAVQRLRVDPRSAVDHENQGEQSDKYRKRKIIRAEYHRAGEYEYRCDQKDRIEALGKCPEFSRHEIKQKRRSCEKECIDTDQRRKSKQPDELRPFLKR